MGVGFGGVTVRWMTAFIDRPPASLEAAERFWLAVTGSTLSPRRGERDQFATLIPPDGDAYLRVQRIDHGAGGSHLDLHADDPEALARVASDAGAERSGSDGEVILMRSPAGLPWCAVRHRGEAERPAPYDGFGTRSQVDQLCIDIPHDRFDEECAFWAAVTGSRVRDTSRPEYRRLDRLAGQPLLLLLQRRDDADGPARAHLDLAADDADALTARHVELGATITDAFAGWIVLRDPSGLPYCVTRRTPDPG
jgi:hypothetical protein